MSVEDERGVEMPAPEHPSVEIRVPGLEVPAPGLEVAAPEASRRPPPKGARCDVCHERGARVRRTSDGLLAVCAACARGVDVAVGDSTAAIAALVPRAPAGERRVLTRRLLARRDMHAARQERRVRLPSSPRDQASSDTTLGSTLE